MITLSRSLALSLLLSVIPRLMFAQHEECGTPDFPLEQRQALCVRVFLCDSFPIFQGNTVVSGLARNPVDYGNRAGVHEWLVDDVTALPPGAYYYVVRTQTRQAHGKLIKH